MTGRGVTPVPLVIPAPFVIPVSSCHSRLLLSFPPPLVIPASSCHSRESGNPVISVYQCLYQRKSVSLNL
jgi:hypothetical protein